MNYGVGSAFMSEKGLRSVSSRERDVEHLQKLATGYAKHIGLLSTHILDETHRRFKARCEMLQRLTFVNLPRVIDLLKQQEQVVSPETATFFKRQLPLVHTLIAQLEAAHVLVPPRWKILPVARNVYKLATCEGCYRIGSVLMLESVPAGETIYPNGSTTAYRNRQRTQVLNCPWCRDHVREVKREAVWVRLNCHRCKASTLMLESVPLGGHPIPTCTWENGYAGRWRKSIVRSCECGDFQATTVDPQLASLTDITQWFSHVGTVGKPA